MEKEKSIVLVNYDLYDDKLIKNMLDNHACLKLRGKFEPCTIGIASYEDRFVSYVVDSTKKVQFTCISLDFYVVLEQAQHDFYVFERQMDFMHKVFNHGGSYYNLTNEYLYSIGKINYLGRYKLLSKLGYEYLPDIAGVAYDDNYVSYMTNKRGIIEYSKEFCSFDGALSDAKISYEALNFMYNESDKKTKIKKKK